LRPAIISNVEVVLSHLMLTTHRASIAYFAASGRVTDSSFLAKTRLKSARPPDLSQIPYIAVIGDSLDCVIRGEGGKFPRH
jgi:hypothetical protein